ncbi:chitin synthase-domain-containing protein [Phlyctochytrium arcticum]|nr:chitin synthase-domain-containing protein [Phlyctochytrium arcticum]
MDHYQALEEDHGRPSLSHTNSYRPRDLTGAAPTRSVTKKQVALTRAGNFVVDQAVSKLVLKNASEIHGEEFTHMRYTAATCEPADFSKTYTLRQRHFKRLTKVALVITMYNEPDILFAKSWYAVMKNIAYLCSDECRYGWGKDGWQNFVVVIVSDGRSKINPKVLTLLGIMGCYADGLAKSTVNGDDVKAHIFEYTTQIAIDKELFPRSDAAKLKMVPAQVIFLLKEKNAKKINSHRWFFNAICTILEPEVTFLLDVGTVPSSSSFYHLYRAFERDKNVGGACGEIKAELGSGWKNLLNPLVATQNFEYKMSNILDKPLESVFGYISVLPGAFSAYRYEALQGAPLECYFRGESMHGGANIFAANMYLAEDRILCFELVTKENSRWLLRYVKDAEAETDVPDQLPELISQRRRWLNGSFFAGLHAVWNWSKIFRSGHSTGRKCALLVEFFYNTINLAFSWFNLANFYLAFYFLFNSAGDSNNNPDADHPFKQYRSVVFQVVREVYIFAVVCVFISSLGNRPQGSLWLYRSIVLGFTLIMILMLFLSGWTVYHSLDYAVEALGSEEISFRKYFRETPAFRDLVVSLLSTYGLYFFGSLAHMDPWHTVTCIVQYMLLLPTYINIFMIYAFCNLHDVSWGTKGDNAPDLGAAIVKTTSDGKQVVEVEMPVSDEELDEAYQLFEQQLNRQRAALHAPAEKQETNAATQQEDGFKIFRTRVVLAWILSNALLVIVFTNEQILAAISPTKANGAPINPYLTFLFWSVAALSFVRFSASMVFLVGYWKTRIAEKRGGRGNGFADNAV